MAGGRYCNSKFNQIYIVLMAQARLPMPQDANVLSTTTDRRIRRTRVGQCRHTRVPVGTRDRRRRTSLCLSQSYSSLGELYLDQCTAGDTHLTAGHGILISRPPTPVGVFQILGITLGVPSTQAFEAPPSVLYPSLRGCGHQVPSAAPRPCL